MPNFKIGNWYPSQTQVRRHYREYQKGILLGKKRLAIVFNYRGAKRKPYGDRINLDTLDISYVGEGQAGNQKLNPRNAALAEASKTRRPVAVFFDCGKIFEPKHLMYAGTWNVTKWTYEWEGGRHIYRFEMQVRTEESKALLPFLFKTQGTDRAFEAGLRAFAKHRTGLYTEFPHILRSRDSIAGEVGEYFALKEFNRLHEDRPLIRLRGGFKDLDAVQILSSKGFAIKTVSSFPSPSSNIWSKDITKGIDYFLLVHLDRNKLAPKFICMSSPRNVIQAGAVRKDNHQGSTKLIIDRPLLRSSSFLLGNRNEWT